MYVRLTETESEVGWKQVEPKGKKRLKSASRHRSSNEIGKIEIVHRIVEKYCWEVRYQPQPNPGTWEGSFRTRFVGSPLNDRDRDRVELLFG